jgi:HopA1 effector protein family
MPYLKKISDFISKFHIDPNCFEINHDDFGRLNFNLEMNKQMINLPKIVQHDFFRSFLIDLVSCTYRNEKKKIVRCQANFSFHDFITQKIISEVDWDFFEQLHVNNTGKGWYNPKFTVAKINNDATISVNKKGITTTINPNYHLNDKTMNTAIGDIVSILTPSYQLSNCFYIAFGDATEYFIEWTYLYLNFTSEKASLIMNTITNQLNKDAVPFIFYVLHNPSNYDRYDSGFIRFEKKDYWRIVNVLKTLISNDSNCFEAEVPMLAKIIAPGIGIAENPGLPFREIDDFCLERSEIISDSLIMAYQTGGSTEKCLHYIQKFFEKKGYDIEKPYLNSNSEDIYKVL